MGHIQVLDFSVANLIAAGEVVDRPASAIKELLENAIDAGATAITVEIKNGGVTFMRVSDNGCGMEKEDVPIAIRRHATSKIRTAADLDGILTLGFRGEALAAIASVSHLRILTRTKDSKMGTLLEAQGGEIVDFCDSGCSGGTTVIVEELFANVPARRKFLKKDQTEAMAVTAVVEKIALSRPDVAIRFIIDHNLKFSTAGDNKLSSAIYAVMGRDFVKKLLPVDFLTDGISVQGYIGRPDNVRGNRNFENFFINGRYIKSGTASAALEQAFRSFMPVEKFPCCVLNVKIHPALVDVNVHPTKLEVKFSNEKIVFDAVYCAVRNTLTAHMTTPEMELRNPYTVQRGMDLRAAFAPVEDRVIEKEKKANMPPQPALDDADKAARAQEISSANPAQAQSAYPFSQTTELLRTDPAQDDIPVSVPHLPTVSDIPPQGAASSSPAVPAEPSTAAAAASDSGLHDLTAILMSGMQSATRISDTPSDKPREPVPSESGSSALHRYRILGVAFHTYILIEEDDRVLIVDKHAAHERIIFEEMKRNRKQSTPATQVLLVPYRADMSIAELDALENYRAEIESTGFQFKTEPDAHRVLIEGVPFGLEEQAPAELFVSMAGQLASGTGDAAVARETAFEEALYQASCKAAVKAGRADSMEHMDWICRKLLELPDIRFCPHGRPVIFELSKHEIEKQFKRT